LQFGLKVTLLGDDLRVYFHKSSTFPELISRL